MDMAEIAVGRGFETYEEVEKAVKRLEMSIIIHFDTSTLSKGVQPSTVEYCMAVP